MDDEDRLTQTVDQEVTVVVVVGENVAAFIVKVVVVQLSVVIVVGLSLSSEAVL